jgi:hypothetical protein
VTVRHEPRDELLAKRAARAGYQDLHGTLLRLGFSPLRRG